ncbi:putative transcription factor GRF family [Medicago truncatula]|uniref:Putative transcription factor GRF family n=1 Tax=Medicago truncatula TaxID=3880 RepID=A0A396HX16_MEDTR|nr:putative transcription factor GRF family [Medicago truncatula]
MSKQMGQSYGSVGSSMRRRAVTECRCGEETVIRTVTDNTNPNCGKKFCGCKNYKNHFDKGCGFFKLLDEEEEVSDERDLLIAKLQKKNSKLKHELEKTRLWLMKALIFGLACFAVCLVLGTILICKISVSWSHMYLK